MYKKEILRQGTKLELKVATSILVYNMLQDMRHLIILDFRKKSDFDLAYIRKSINVDLDSFKERLMKEFLKNPNSIYQGDDLKRVLFIFPAD